MSDATFRRWLGAALLGIAMACAPTTGAAQQPEAYAFDICIKPASGVVMDGGYAVATLQRAFRIAHAHPAWPSNVPKNLPRIEFDCEFQPAALGMHAPAPPTSATQQSSFQHIPVQSMSPPKTPFGTVIVVLPREDIERLFWSRDYSGFATTRQRSLSEEGYCQGHVCVTTTSAHYLMPTEAADSELLALWALRRYGVQATAESVREAAAGIPPVDPPAPPDQLASWTVAPFVLALMNVFIVGAAFLALRTFRRSTPSR